MFLARPLSAAPGEGSVERTASLARMDRRHPGPHLPVCQPPLLHKTRHNNTWQMPRLLAKMTVGARLDSSARPRQAQALHTYGGLIPKFYLADAAVGGEDDDGRKAGLERAAQVGKALHTLMGLFCTRNLPGRCRGWWRR